MNKNWKKEIARDTMALGSIPFYFIVIIRAIIGKYAIFVYQLIIAAFFLYFISKLIKKFNFHIARGFILITFTSLFYKENLFTVFALLLWILMIVSAHIIKIKKNEIYKGVVFGILVSIISYLISPLIYNIIN